RLLEFLEHRLGPVLGPDRIHVERIGRECRQCQTLREQRNREYGNGARGQVEATGEGDLESSGGRYRRDLVRSDRSLAQGRRAQLPTVTDPRRRRQLRAKTLAAVFRRGQRASVCRPMALRLYCEHHMLDGMWDWLAAQYHPCSTGGFDVALAIADTRAAAGFWRLGDFRPDKMA